MDEQLRISLTRYRWVILVVCCLIALSCGSEYAWSALSAPMAVELGESPENLTIAFSVCNAIGFISMIIGGIIYQKRGPKVTVMLGGILFGLGMFFSGFAQNVSHLIITYGICLGFGLSFVYGCIISNTIKFFPDRRGMVGGMITACYGCSSVIFAPIGAALSSVVGARATFKILGIVFLIVICLGALFMKNCPEGFLPVGYVASENEKKNHIVDCTPKEMIKSPKFYVMLIMMTSAAVFGLMVISNAKGIALNMLGVAQSTAVVYVSVLCLFNTFGRLAAGVISDKIGRIQTLTGALALALVGLTLLLLVSINANVLMFTIGIILVGICFGTFMGVFPGFTTDQFGTKYNVVNYGIMWTGFSVAGLIGPMILSKIYTINGTYIYAYLVAIVIAALGLCMTFVYRKITS